MSLELTRIIASKYNAEPANISTIFDLSSSTSTALLTVTIKNGYVFYLIAYGGNVQNTDINITLYDRANQIIQEYTEFPDSFVRFEYYPHVKEGFKDKILVKFTNNSGSTDTITFFVEGILIPGQYALNFERELKELLIINNLGQKPLS